MTFEDFKTYAKNSIKNYLPEEYQDASVELQETRKLNDHYTSLLVCKEEQSVVPTVNLDHFYEAYQQNENIVDALRSIAELITSEEPVFVNIDAITDYEKAKEKLYIRVNKVEGNEEILGSCPHKIMDDLVLTYHVEIYNPTMHGVGSTMVTNRLLDGYGISQEQLHEDAMTNSPVIHPMKMETMTNVLFNAGLAAKEAAAEGQDDIDYSMVGAPEYGLPLYVLTNQQMAQGAAVLFYPDMMEQIAEKLEGSFFVLPSSTHEVLLVPAAEVDDSRFLDAMVEEVNESMVDPSERLTDHAYHYDAEDKVFERASVFETRKLQKVAEQGDKVIHSKQMEKPKKNEMSL